MDDEETSCNIIVEDEVLSDGYDHLELMSQSRGAALGLQQLHARDPPMMMRDFKPANILLDKDTFLRQNMDDQGLVSINLIAARNQERKNFFRRSKNANMCERRRAARRKKQEEDLPLLGNQIISLGKRQSKYSLSPWLYAMPPKSTFECFVCSSKWRFTH
ncbi:hypothetical protein RND71_005486 [Anisodus tanguticus]|uniref:Protein kinase domain-containing protein n=1 Tax=Anisodus tanguticus TaxID=243964 RepID=A0AAE1SS07_9SOLA|nr:hypothetical protein RND71_005486 [Anisodus tanguticus]